MTIRIIAGAAFVDEGSKRRVITPDDGPVRLPKKLEARFVNLGVAEYVDGASQAPAAKRPDKPTEVVQSPDDFIVEDPASGYGDMSVAELKAECDARGITYGRRANSAQLIRLLKADDNPPAISAHGVES